MITYALFEYRVEWRSERTADWHPWSNNTKATRATAEAACTELRKCVEGRHPDAGFRVVERTVTGWVES